MGCVLNATLCGTQNTMGNVNCFLCSEFMVPHLPACSSLLERERNRMETAVGTTEGLLSQNNSSLLESHCSKAGGRAQMWLLVKNT
jgi:hypothetical protein